MNPGPLVQWMTIAIVRSVEVTLTISITARIPSNIHSKGILTKVSRIPVNRCRSPGWTLTSAFKPWNEAEKKSEIQRGSEHNSQGADL